MVLKECLFILLTNESCIIIIDFNSIHSNTILSGDLFDKNYKLEFYKVITQFWIFLFK